MIRAFQWDLARQVERLDVLKGLLPRYAAWGYQELYLHLEDAVHYPGLPGIGRDDAYSHEDLGELVLAAAQSGIRVVPIVNLLGHTQYLIKHPEWRDLNELRDGQNRPLEQGQLCPLHPRALEVAEKLLRDMAPYCTAGKMHVGLDESFHLGKCPRCREEVARIGLGGHFAGHVSRLHALCGRYGLQLGMWADMLYFTPEAIPLLPRGIVAYDWYYYSFVKKPRVELFNFAERDLYPALKRQGIGYYGCPMNGAFRHEPLPVFGDRIGNIRSWWERCQAVKADGLLITSWEASRLALATTTTVDAAAASLWLRTGPDDATSLLAEGLARAFKIKTARPLARLLLAADEHAFTGYARWQINDRWDVFAGTESLKPCQAEVRFFHRLLAPHLSWPKPFAASLSFRHYLALRDVFVRRAAREVFQLRRLPPSGPTIGIRLKQMQASAREFGPALKAGRQAVRAMWGLTRDPQRRGQNDVLLEADAQRLNVWKRWLRRAIRDHRLITQATPVCGAWQLQFTVHNFAPAAQKVMVEQQGADGIWHELASRYTIEFRSAVACPRGRLKREFTVPVSAPGTPLRVAVHGIGQVAVSHLALTDGVRRLAAAGGRVKRILGKPAQQRGWPRIVSGPESPALPLDSPAPPAAP
jgi:hypothetical protein